MFQVCLEENCTGIFMFTHLENLPMLWSTSLRQAEDELRPDPFRADHINVFSVGLDDFPDNG